jgi:hypothetical protein
MKMKTRWHMHFSVILAPFTIPLAAGAYWLWLHQMLILWVGTSAVLGSKPFHLNTPRRNNHFIFSL